MWARQGVWRLCPAKTCEILWTLQKIHMHGPVHAVGRHVHTPTSQILHVHWRTASYSCGNTTPRQPPRWARLTASLHQSRRMAMTATKVRMLSEHATVGLAKSESGLGKGRNDVDVGAGVCDGVGTELGTGVGAGVTALGDGVDAGIG